jgi:hypothetical protein
MPNSRRALILSTAVSAFLCACGGGSSGSAGDGGGGGPLGSSDTLAITSFAPSSAPAASALPITFTVSYSFDLETVSSAVITAGYQVATGQVVATASTQAVTKGAGRGSLSFSLPAAALSSAALGVAVTLTDTATGAVLAQDVALVPRTP